MKREQVDVVVLGGGPAGLACARACSSGSRGTVLVLDHAAARTSAPKLRAAGGGRCNVSNAEVLAADYVCANPHFVKSALARFGPGELDELLAELGLAAHTEEGGKRFCSRGKGGGAALAEGLVEAARQAGAELRAEVEVLGARTTEQGFLVRTSRDGAQSEIVCNALVLALGSRAWPSLGATGAGYELARSLGLAVTRIRPGLVPLLAAAEERGFCQSLSGLSLPVEVSVGVGKTVRRVRDELLFTHQGVSGPAVLTASLYWREGVPLFLDFLPKLSEETLLKELRARGRAEGATVLGTLLPKRLAQALSERAGVRGRLAERSTAELARLVALVKTFELPVAATAGFERAEVCLGGVALSEVSSKTMEAKQLPGLYVVGELLDVAGRLGGFNIHWALASGLAAGEALRERGAAARR